MKSKRLSPSRICIASLALLSVSLGYGQIDEDRLSTLITTLEGDDFEARHEARLELQDHVSAAGLPGRNAERLAVEAQLLERLREDLPDTTRLWLLRQVAMLGSEAAVDVLAALLEDPSARVADAARMTLEVNPAERASHALLAALQTASGDEIVGLILSLANRGHSDAVDTIAQHLDSERDEVVDAAILALEKLGDKVATKHLRGHHAHASGQAKAAVELALLRLEDDLSFLQELALRGTNRAVRSAAFEKSIRLNPGQANRIFIEALEHGEEPGSSDFIRVALESGKPALKRTALKSLESRSPAEQAVVLGALGEKKSGTLEKIVLDIAATDSEPLRVQAIEALGRVGSVKSLPLLVEALDSRSREIRETAAEAIARIPDPKLDRTLLRMAETGATADRILAIKALSYRASPGAAELVTRLAERGEDIDLSIAALAAIEHIGTVESLPVLVDLIVSESNSKLRREAQRTVKRMTLRTADPDAAWAAFEAGLAKAGRDKEARMALVNVLDSAPTADAIAYLEAAWAEGDEQLRKGVLRALPAWRNWDGGYALLEIAEAPETSPADRKASYQGIGRLILGSDASYAFDQKFDLAASAIEKARTPEERQSVINGFRYATWRERVYVTNNPVDPELKEAVLAFAKN